MDSGTEEMPQWLGSPASLPEDPNLIPITLKWQLTGYYSFEGPLLASASNRRANDAQAYKVGA